MKDIDGEIMFNLYVESQERKLLREEYHDCFRDCKGEGRTDQDCRAECSHMIEDDSGENPNPHGLEEGSIRELFSDMKILNRFGPVQIIGNMNKLIDNISKKLPNPTERQNQLINGLAAVPIAYALSKGAEVFYKYLTDNISVDEFFKWLDEFLKIV